MPYRLGGTIYQTREQAFAAVEPYIRQAQAATRAGRQQPRFNARARQMVNDWEAILDAEQEEANARNAAMNRNNNNENEEHQQQQHALWLAQQQQHAAFLAQGHAPLPHVPLHNILNMGPINVPEGTRNEISMNNIEEGNTLVNFRGTEPNSFESKFGYFYKPNTFYHLTQNPRTRGPMHNYRRRTAHIVPKKNKIQNGSPKARKNRKSRRSARK
jgi:hypothetical protein